MKAQIEAGLVNGGWGLMRIGGGAESEITHIAYSEPQDLTALLQIRNPSPAFAAFRKTMAEVRSVMRLAVNFLIIDLQFLIELRGVEQESALPSRTMQIHPRFSYNSLG